MREAPAIDAYGGGGFRISGVRREGSVLIFEDQVAPFAPRAVGELTTADFKPVLERPTACEFVLLGAGPTPRPAPRVVREALWAAGVGLEVMSTAEACRLYNVLASEGRLIAAALIALP